MAKIHFRQPDEPGDFKQKYAKSRRQLVVLRKASLALNVLLLGLVLWLTLT